MKKGVNKEIDKILDSVQGMRKASPNEHLFAKIEQQLDASGVRVIPLTQVRWITVAASLLLLLNISMLYQFQEVAVSAEVSSVDQTSLPALVTDLNIY